MNVCIGLIFDESIVPDKTLEPEHTKPKVSLIQDPKQSQVMCPLASDPVSVPLSQ